jgi:hypothetical protein
MDIRRVKEEMQFLSGVITSDVDYLLYLLLKREKEVETVSEVTAVDNKSYLSDEVLDDWFNNL